MDSESKSDLWRHDLRMHTWTKLGEPPAQINYPHEEAAMAGLNGRIYIAGGYTGDDSDTDRKHMLLIFDTCNSSWSGIPLPIKRSENKANLVALGQKLYLSCIVGSDHKLFSFDVNIQVWTELASPPGAQNLVGGGARLFTLKIGVDPVVHSFQVDRTGAVWNTLELELNGSTPKYSVHASTRVSWHNDTECLVVTSTHAGQTHVFALDLCRKKLSHLDRRWLDGEHVHSSGPWVVFLGGYIGDPYFPCMAPKRLFLEGSKGKDACADPQSQLLMKLHKSMQQSEFADVTCIVEGREVQCHRLVLSNASEHFRAMFSCGMKESNTQRVELPNISFATFQHVLCYLYTTKLPSMSELSLTQIQELLQAAKYLLVKELPQQLIGELSKQIDNSNVCSVLQFADTISSEALKGACLHHIKSNYLTMLQGRHMEGLQAAPELLLEVMYSCASVSLPKRPRLAE